MAVMLEESKRVTGYRPWRRLAAATVAAALLVLGAWWHRQVYAARPPRAAPVAAIPVSIAEVRERDVPIYRDGLGTVQAASTVAIHSQVDGRLQGVNFVEGQQVRRGDVLARIDPRLFQAALDQAKAKKGQDEAQLVSAQKDLVRFQSLLAKNFDSQQNVDRQTALVAQLTATIAADEAAIESAQTQLDYTTITAPVDGRVGIRQVDPGNIVHVADLTPVVVLTQTRPISIVFTLPESALDEVRGAMARGPVAVLAYDQSNAQQLASGTLLLIDNQIDQSTSTIRLKATFPNEDERLWPGEFVHVRLLLESRAQVVAVPSSAVQRGPDGPYVWLLAPDGTAQIRPITPGPTEEGHTVLDGGVQAGDQVVVAGQSRLQPGSRVSVTAADARGPSS